VVVTPVVLGLIALVAALALVLLVVVPQDRARLSRAREPRATARAWRERATERAEAAVRRGDGAVGRLLDLAGWRASAGTVALVIVLAAAGSAALGVLLAITARVPAAWLLPVLLPLAALGVGRLVIERRIESRRAAFAEQLESTLVQLASGLRAGHSLQRALASVAQDSPSPTAEEFARIVNEHKLGVDLGEAMHGAAERMRSDDVAWTAQAIAIHREVGGNLGEVLDHIAETIRERQQIRRQVQTLSAEGRSSAVVLMVLPIAIAALLSVLSPDYLSSFFTSPIGLLMGGLSLVLFLLGGLWLRAVTRIRF
jgi:tight adherence protein B